MPFQAIFHLLTCFATFLLPSAAMAQTETSSLFTRDGHADLAIEWLRALFRGEPLFENAQTSSFTQVTDSVHQVLGLYSSAMLVLASFLLLYYTVMFVSQTAQTGQIPWMQKSKMWAPLRFALVMGLLVPVGGGLNLGQYVVVKLAEQGSALASNAWENATTKMKESFAGLVAPRPPDLRHVTTRAVEMALCQTFYKHYYEAYAPDAPLTAIGPIKGLERLPPERLVDETWRYANKLHETPPLCGAYRFLAPSLNNGQESVEKDPILFVLGDSARASAERLSIQAGAFADSVASSFLKDRQIPPPSAHAVFQGMLREQDSLLNTRIKGLTEKKARIEDELLASTQDSGWISAGKILLDLMNRQTILGLMNNSAVPEVDPPILGHAALDYEHLAESIRNNPDINFYGSMDLHKLHALYQGAGGAMKRARVWLYQNQLPDPELVLASAFDVQDTLANASDPDKGFTVFRRVLDAAFASFGVWGRAMSDEEEVSSVTLSAEMMHSPMAALAEMGRRYTNMGVWVMGVASPSLTTPSIMVSAALYVLIGGLIALAGLGLLFLVPMLPLFRFVSSVLMWLLLVFEAVVSVPLVAIAHMDPAGEGLTSQAAKRAYILWLSVFVRPFLIIFGFLVGWAGFYLGTLFLNMSFSALSSELAIMQIDSLTMLRVFFSLLYALMVLIVTNVAFKGISFFPNRAVEWLGGLVHGGGTIEIESHQQAATAKAETSTSTHAASNTEDRHTAHTDKKEAFARTGGPTQRPSKESPHFPYYQDKELPSLMVSQTAEGGRAVASSESGQAAAGAASDQEKAIAIATAKATVILGDKEKKEKGQHALTDMAKETKTDTDRLKKEQEEEATREAEEGEEPQETP